MGLFAELTGFVTEMTKLAVKYGDSEKDYIDVTNKVVGSLPDAAKAVHITANLSLKLRKSDGGVSCKVFVKDADGAEDITFSHKTKGGVLHIDLHTAAGDIKCYAELCLPECKELAVANTYGDTVVRKVKAARLAVEAESGDVLLKRTRFDDATVETKSGDILVILDEGKYRIEAESKHGDVLKKARSDAVAEKSIVCRSRSGDIQVKQNSNTNDEQ